MVTVAEQHKLMNAVYVMVMVLQMVPVTVLVMLKIVLVNVVVVQKTVPAGKMIPVPMSLLLQ